MKICTGMFFLQLLIHQLCAKSRTVRVTKLTSVYSAHLPSSIMFAPVRGAVECVPTFLDSGALFMLVRPGADGALQCGQASILPRSVWYGNGNGDVTVYYNPTKIPMCRDLSCSKSQQVGIVHFCINKEQSQERYKVADDWCYSLGATLGEAGTSTELDVLISMSNRRMWVGADDFTTPGQFHWKSGDLVDRSWFAPNEPDAPNERCLALDKNGLMDYPCAAELMVICSQLCLP